jgi:protein-S-isoprenylcysteine O-methyltransferase Ste14
MIAFIAMLVFPAIDHRYGWSTVPPCVALAGDILVAIGFLAIFFVFKENSYASSIIEVGTEQKIVTTGPYAVVRHPMYSGALVMLLGIPLALGSWWGCSRSFRSRLCSYGDCSKKKTS